MDKKKIFTLVLLIVLIGIGGWLVPILPIKVLAGFANIILVAILLFNFGAKVVGFLVLSMLVFLSLVSITTFKSISRDDWFFDQFFGRQFRNFDEDDWNDWDDNWDDWFDDEFPWDEDNQEDRTEQKDSESSPKEIDDFAVIQPNKSTESSEKITIDVSSAKILLVDNDIIEYPDVVKVSKLGKEIKLSSNLKNSTALIRVGVKNLKELSINSSANKIVGDANFTKLVLNGSALSVSGIINADEFLVNGSAISLDINSKGKTFKVKGSAVTLTGLIDYKAVNLDGSLITLNFRYSIPNKISINGSMINGTIEYTGQQMSQLSIKSSSGMLYLKGNHDNIKVSKPWGFKIEKEER